ncbi:MAG: hypothetical protein AAF671_11930 [Pseudomonadota bacterium]
MLRHNGLPMSKPCEKCAELAVVRYRIQLDDSNTWYLVCPSCQQKYSLHNPNYRYGGTWKAKKKRR